MNTKTIGVLVGLAPLFVLAWGSTGCGGDSFNFSLPDGDVVPWGGSIQVVAEIREQGSKPKDGRNVNFTLDVGSFEPFEEGHQEEPVREIRAKTAGGQATVEVFSFPGEGGDSGQISATYETIGKKSLSGSIPISIANGGKPSGNSLTAQCDPVNVTAIDASGAQADPDMKIRCTLTIKDVANEPVPIATIQTRVEGRPSSCSLQEDPDQNTGPTHVFTLKADCLPMDVEPLDGEPNHMFAGEIHNPRDGLLTILFAVKGQEGFSDANSNGVYDPGEGFVGQDQAEPFLDTNDSGDYDSGEAFIDNNENGQWDPADGRWNDDVWISASTHIMFTGPPHQSAETTHFEPAGINIPDGGNQTLYYHLVDQNHNPIAANGGSDRIDFDPSDLTISDTTNYPQDLVNVMGVTFSQDGSLNLESLSSPEGRVFEVQVEDRHPGDQNPYQVSLLPSVTYTTAPSYDGYSGEHVDVDLNPITGTAN